MKIESMTENELMAFCRWFADIHGNTTEPSVFTTCLCGYFHTYTKAANQVLKRCKRSGLVTVKENEVTIMLKKTYSDPSNRNKSS